ncbi:hemagglutinin repeat-containing protein [Parvibium lacunae]|uniref:Filamentous hemagglutinin N-terminal domain-containing protein n=1 Tax=Parvibium lacunae TaxID=1888893 RepID=A0A368KZF6_9BURK|nr:hemagglutinin repeat-containing protein [Parvibium lacunae]RCS56522.1 hypothetical protein DU000_11165 [Parvibium lacunae]
METVLKLQAEHSALPLRPQPLLRALCFVGLALCFPAGLSAHQQSGNLTLLAGTDVTQGDSKITTQGADLLAKQKISLTAGSLDLQAISDTLKERSQTQANSFTIGARPAGVIGGAISRISDSIQQAQQTDNDRLKGALALKAGYDAWKLMGRLSDGNTSAPPSADGKPGDPNNSAFAINVSMGGSRSTSSSSFDSSTVRGTNLQGQDIELRATQGDISGTALKVQGTNITLDAARDLKLQAGANTQTLQSTNSSSNASVGVTIGVGGQQNGISFQLAAAQARGRSNGSETTWDNSQITASEQLSVKTGRDASLQGAQLAGDRVKLDIGRDLTLQTLQNQSDYQSSQSSSGFSLSLCIPPICYGQTVSGSLNVARSSLNHNYLSAVGQSGIAAGQGGFDINVKGHTQLTGATRGSSEQVR